MSLNVLLELLLKGHLPLRVHEEDRLPVKYA